MNLDRHLLPKLDALLCALGSLIILSLLVYFYPSTGKEEYRYSVNTFEGVFVAVEYLPNPDDGFLDSTPPTFGFVVDGVNRTVEQNDIGNGSSLSLESSKSEWLHVAPGKAVFVRTEAESFPMISVELVEWESQSAYVPCRVTVSFRGKVNSFSPERTRLSKSTRFRVPEPQ